MDQVEILLNKLLGEQGLIYAVLSNLRKKDENSFTKVTIKPVLIKENLKYQFTYEYKTKDTHNNLSNDESVNEIIS